MPVETDFTGNIERFSGFADDYDKYRPTPPDTLKEILCGFACISFPRIRKASFSDEQLGIDVFSAMAEQPLGSQRETVLEFTRSVWDCATSIDAAGNEFTVL